MLYMKLLQSSFASSVWF